MADGTNKTDTGSYRKIPKKPLEEGAPAVPVGVPGPAPSPYGEPQILDPSATLAGVLGSESGEKFALIFGAGPFSLFRRIGSADRPPEAGIVFAGTVARMAVPDVLSIAHATGLEGELVFQFKDAVKRVFLRGGSIIFATSTLFDDRLGELLLAQGRLNRKSFEQASEECTKNKKKLGRILVEMGILTAHDVFEALREQVEAIVLSLFNYTEGTFCFVAGPVALANPIRLPNSVSHYVLEGVRQGDELKPALDEVSDRMAVFKLSGAQALAVADGRPGMERDVAELLDGVSAVWQILARSSWSEANTLLALARLLRAGVIRRVKEESAEAPKATNVLEIGAARKLITAVNEFLGGLHTALVTHGGRPAAVAGFLDEVSPRHRGLFARASFREDGTLDADRMLQNFASLPESPAEASKIFREGLQDVMEFALWVASDQVPEEEARRLATAARSVGES